MSTTVDPDAQSPSPTPERSPPTESPDADAVYRRTVVLLRRWASDEANGAEGTLREHHLRRYLWEELDAAGCGATVTSPRGTDKPDIVVDGTVGVKIVSSLNQGATGWFHRELHTLCEGYDYLVVFGYGIDGEHTDRWRHLQSSVTASDIDLRGITFLDTLDEEVSTPESGRLPVAPETAALLALGTPMALLGARVLAEFVLSLETIGTGLLAAVAMTYLFGTSLLALSLQSL